MAVLIATGSPAAAASASASEQSSNMPSAQQLQQGSLACTNAAARAVPSDVQARITCAGDLLTATFTRSGAEHEQVTEMSTGKTAELTGLPERQRQQRLQEVRAGAMHPMVGWTNIESQYRASTQEVIWYAIIENGAPTFVSYVWKRSIISLQMRSHRIEVSWVQLQKRPITFEIPIRTREDVPLWWDRTVDDQLLGGITYQTSKKDVAYMSTDGPGVFYWEMYDRYINDETQGRFKVTYDMEGPHFRCYKTVPCKYPNGKEAHP
ncbi:hypothetical protein [Amycolatopsis sp. WGS_07]|uniref:hypothetical protein n=1 Tax=Amycolatopsis sp. WGS_07 TaxID=3076764 RepID=UPI0038734025